MRTSEGILLAALVLLADPVAGAAERSNIVLIMADDLEMGAMTRRFGFDEVIDSLALIAERKRATGQRLREHCRRPAGRGRTKPTGK